MDPAAGSLARLVRRRGGGDGASDVEVEAEDRRVEVAAWDGWGCGGGDAALWIWRPAARRDW